MSRAYNTGLIAAMLTSLAAAMLTGLVLMGPYEPSGQAAHQSVAAITESGLFNFLRNVHHWASALLIVLGGAYIIVGLVRGAYRKPGQWLWISSIIMLLLGIGMQLTGHLLPYDVQAVRTAVVESGIAANVPIVGEAQGNLIRGGATVGEHTLRLWHLAHVGIFSVVCLVLLFAVPTFARRVGTTLLRAKWIAGSLLLLVTFGFLPSPLGDVATAMDFSDQNARPEWYILPLHSLLVFVNDRQIPAFIGTMLIPGLVLIILVLLPWIHRRGTPTLGRALGAVGALGLAGLFLFTFSHVAPPIGEQVEEGQVTGLSAPVKLDPQVVARGKGFYAKAGCDSCHRINGVGEKVGPDLSNEGARGRSLEWQVDHLRDPKSKVAGSTMPAFKRSDYELTALAQYVTSLKQ
jgi:quinol-cytochrome oxidoreductase complex cytochrome b subunit